MHNITRLVSMAAKKTHLKLLVTLLKVLNLNSVSLQLAVNITHKIHITQNSTIHETRKHKQQIYYLTPMGPAHWCLIPNRPLFTTQSCMPNAINIRQQRAIIIDCRSRVTSMPSLPGATDRPLPLFIALTRWLACHSQIF